MSIQMTIAKPTDLNQIGKTSSSNPTQKTFFLRDDPSTSDLLLSTLQLLNKVEDRTEARGESWSEGSTPARSTSYDCYDCAGTGEGLTGYSGDVRASER